MKMWNFVALLALLALLGACAKGTDFTKPEDDKLAFGKTTKSEVIAMMGEPTRKQQVKRYGKDVDIIYYDYAKLGGEPAIKGETPERTEVFLFHEDLLVGTEYTSSFKDDSTWFDVSKVDSIKQGMSVDEVIAIMGKPGGEYRYPAIYTSEGRALVYLFDEIKGFTLHQTTLIVVLDANDKVEKTDLQTFEKKGL